MRCVQNKYIVTEYNSQKIVATVMCTEKRTIPRIPPFSYEKETIFTYDGVEITTNSDEIYNTKQSTPSIGATAPHGRG